VIRITDMDGQLVWRGTGTVRIESSPLGPCRVEVTQRSARPDGALLSRALALPAEPGGGVHDWTVEYDVPVPDVYSADCGEYEIPFPQVQECAWTLRMDAPEGLLRYLAEQLSQPVETPQEREERLAERARRNIWPDRYAALRDQDSRLSGEAIRPDRYAALRDQASRLSGEAIRPELAEALELMGASARSAESIRASLGGLMGVPPELTGSYERNEQAITSAREAFPYDPLDYGRVYPGNAGTSRWTPPADPDEKVRSCP